MYGILVDVTRCRGCERCAEACALANNPEAEDTQWSAPGSELSAWRLCTIESLPESRFARRSCMHCLHPACVSACLVGGITKTAEGPVIYDRQKCIGCRYCMLACPHHIPRYEWDNTIPYMKKCDMCWQRLQQGKQPACVEACPYDALKFGDRQDLLREAHRRISAQDRPYLPRVYGENEWGGTSVLYVSDVDLSALDWPAQTAPPISELTDPLIEKTPFVGVGVAFGLWALGAIIARRNEVTAAGEHSGRGGKRDPESGDHTGEDVTCD
jgi:formate dehydrogenase iron-sulfur subunit